MLRQRSGDNSTAATNAVLTGTVIDAVKKNASPPTSAGMWRCRAARCKPRSTRFSSKVLSIADASGDCLHPV